MYLPKGLSRQPLLNDFWLFLPNLFSFLMALMLFPQVLYALQFVHFKHLVNTVIAHKITQRKESAPHKASFFLISSLGH